MIDTDFAETSPLQERLILLVLATVQFTAIVDFMVIMPLEPELKRTIGLTPVRFAAVVSAYTFAAGLAGLVSTLVLDRFARRPTFLVLFAGFMLGTLACGLAPDYGMLLAARCLTGVFGGLLGGMAMTIIGDVFPEERRGEATGTLMSAFALASVAGVPIGLTLGQWLGWHTPFLILAGLCVPFFFVAARVLPRLDGHLKDHKVEPAGDRLREIFLHTNHLRAFALTSALMFSGFSVIPFLTPYLVSNVGLAEEWIFWPYVAGGLVSLVGMPVIGRLADKYGKLRVYRVVIPANAALLLMMTCLPRGLSLPLILLAVAATMLSNAGRMVPAMAMITGSVEPRLRGGFMGANSAVQHIAAGIGTTIAGLILTQPKGEPIANFPTVGLIAALTSLSTLWLAGRLRSGSPKPVAEPVAAAAEFA